MTTNRLTITFLLLTGFLAGACKKQLNIYPTTQEVNGNIITDEKSAFTALNGVYYKFASGGTDYNGVPATSWYNVNEEIPADLTSLTYNSSGGGLEEHTYTSNTYSVDAAWTYGYALVNAANGFLENIAPVSSITPSVKNSMIAEARFLRAYGNSEVLLYYGQYYDTTSPYGIIMHNQFTTPNDLSLPRSSVGVAYDSILSDLDAAIPVLPGLNTSIANVNTWAARLLKARVLINRGSQTDYATVISLTKDIIANGPFTLEPNVQDIFWTKGFTSQEVMLGVQPYPTQNVKWSDYIYYDQYPPNDLFTVLLTGDPRASWYIQTTNTPFGALPALTKYYPGSVSTTAATPISENGYAFRLTEAYLLEAEAIVASGGSLADAKPLLKTVLTHAGFTDFTAVDNATTAADLQLQIIEEEIKNFASEAGQDWFAIRRLPFTTLQSLLPTVLNKSLLILPIPDAEITANHNVKQNPNY
jgi:phage terminase large subunit-like protein